MSGPPLESSASPSANKSISSLSSKSMSSSTTPSSSPFGSVKSSLSRKKPLGLDISRSIPKPSRSASILAGPDSALTDGASIDSKEGGSVSWMSEGDRLRDEIARLQLSSKSTSSSFASGPESPPGISPTGLYSSYHLAPASAAGAHAGSGPSSSTSSSGTRKKKSSSSIGKKKRDGDDTVKEEDLEVLADLGSGNGGTVTKVWNKRRKCIMAKKLILVDAKPSIRKQILRELQIMNDCSSPYIVGYYGCFPVDVHVGIVMEYMDIGSLDYIYRQTGAVPIRIVGKVAEAVLRGLVYLYDVHRIIHRDIKPSNILANSSGDIKICDFGVSGELINSIANTFVGTSTYMSPERIQGAPYTIKSDVWSLGISLVELAQGRFPFADPPDDEEESGDDEDAETPIHPSFDPDATLPLSTQRPRLPLSGDVKRRKKKRGVSLGGGGMTMSILDLLQHIVNEPAPKLANRHHSFPHFAEVFVDGCLDKDPNKRWSPQELLESDWIRHSTVTADELREWAHSVLQSTKE